MAQRPLDVYGALTPAQRTDAERALTGSGCEALFAYRPRYRLEKRNFKLAFAG